MTWSESYLLKFKSAYVLPGIFPIAVGVAYEVTSIVHPLLLLTLAAHRL